MNLKSKMKTIKKFKKANIKIGCFISNLKQKAYFTMI